MNRFCLLILLFALISACNDTKSQPAETPTTGTTLPEEGIPMAPDTCHGLNLEACAREIDMALGNLGDPVYASEIAACCIDEHPNYLPFKVQMGRVQRQAGRLDQALAIYTDVISEAPTGDPKPDDPVDSMNRDAVWQAMCGLGETHLIEGETFDLPAANTWLTSAANLRPAAGRPLAGLAQVAELNKDLAAAATLLEAALEREYRPNETEVRLARLLLRKFEVEQDQAALSRAGEVLQAIVRKDRSVVAAQRALSEYHNLAGEPVEAAVAEMWAEYYTGNPNWTRVEQLFSEHDLKDTSANARNLYLLMLMSLNFNDYDIRQAIDQAIEDYPQHAEFVVTKVGYLTRRDEWGDAAATVEAGIEKFPASSRLLIYASDIAEQENQPEQARGYIIQAIQADPYEATAMEEAAKFLQKLANQDREWLPAANAAQAMLFHAKGQIPEAWVGFNLDDVDPKPLGIEPDYYLARAMTGELMNDPDQAFLKDIQHAVTLAPTSPAILSVAIDMAERHGRDGLSREWRGLLEQAES